MIIVLFLYSIGIFLFPLYSFSSGGMQLSHMFLLLGSLVFFFKNHFYVKNNISIKLIFSLAALIFIREFYGLIFQLGSIEYINSVYFIFYNLIIFSFFLSYLISNGFSKYLTFSLLGSIGLAIIPILIQGINLSVSSGATRVIGTFNNPNQLGYFSVCIFSILTCLYYFKKINNITYFLSIIFAILLCILSLSKAAMVALTLAILFFSLDYAKHHPKKLILAISLILLFSYKFILNLDLEDLTFVNRISNIGSDNDDSLAGRGYNVIFEATGLELAFGLGVEKVVGIFGHEVHSTFMSMMIHYGILGFIIFSFFIFYIFYNVYNKLGLTKTSVLFIPFFVYGITHNGTRFTIFWIFLALILYFSRYYKQRELSK